MGLITLIEKVGKFIFGKEIKDLFFLEAKSNFFFF